MQFVAVFISCAHPSFNSHVVHSFIIQEPMFKICGKTMVDLPVKENVKIANLVIDNDELA